MDEAAVGQASQEQPFDLFRRGFFDNEDRSYSRPHWLTRVPRFDLDDVCALLAALEQKGQMKEFIAGSYSAYRLEKYLHTMDNSHRSIGPDDSGEFQFPGWQN